jgi:hypothetical protein
LVAGLAACAALRIAWYSHDVVLVVVNDRAGVGCLEPGSRSRVTVWV